MINVSNDDDGDDSLIIMILFFTSAWILQSELFSTAVFILFLIGQRSTSEKAAFVMKAIYKKPLACGFLKKSFLYIFNFESRVN